jgi:uncharacterized SAM-dependent methyltransferase
LKYFKTSELTRLYSISDKTVHNWIESARNGTIDLDLQHEGSKVYILDNLHNEAVIESLVERGKKYRNSRTYKKVTPQPKFYELYSHREIVEIINALDIRREFPIQLRYRAEGARYWDAYLQKLYKSPRINMLNATIELLKECAPRIDSWIHKKSHLNVVDVGVGNGLAIKSFLERAIKTGKLRQYIAVDTSTELLSTTEQNVTEWFKKSDFNIKKCICDIGSGSFAESLATSSFDEDASSTLNLVLFLGSTVVNFRDPDQVLSNLRRSLGKDDLLISSLKLDSSRSRRFFDFNTDDHKSPLSLFDKFVLDLLSIDESFYEVEQFYDAQREARIIQIRLQITLAIEFKSGDYQKIVEIQKGEVIEILFAKHYSYQKIIDIYARNGLNLLQAVVSDTHEHILLITKVKSG